MRQGDRMLSLRHPGAGDVTYAVNAQGTVRARYVDAETGTGDDSQCLCAVERRSLLWLGLSAARAQQPALDPRSSFRIDFPKDSPLAVVSADMGDSVASARGSAMVIDLHTSLSLRNSGPRRVRGVTLLVTAQEVTAGGKASVSVPSLNVGPGETFPVRVELRLLRPLFPPGPLVQVSLDGVLFEDLSFYGPEQAELTAHHDRLGDGGAARPAPLQVRAGGARRGRACAGRFWTAWRGRPISPRLDVQVARGGRATNVAAERQVQFTFLRDARFAGRARGRHGARRGQRGPRPQPGGAQPLRPAGAVFRGGLDHPGHRRARATWRARCRPPTPT